ncbi:MAG: hypothetical protein JST09_01100 [Bacteroidetes bacterium]|nr:hypothetical protein [Bacteroidota bacterium]
MKCTSALLLPMRCCMQAHLHGSVRAKMFMCPTKSSYEKQKFAAPLLYSLKLLSKQNVICLPFQQSEKVEAVHLFSLNKE